MKFVLAESLDILGSNYVFSCIQIFSWPPENRKKIAKLFGSHNYPDLQTTVFDLVHTIWVTSLILFKIVTGISGWSWGIFKGCMHFLLETPLMCELAVDIYILFIFNWRDTVVQYFHRNEHSCGEKQCMMVVTLSLALCPRIESSGGRHVGSTYFSRSASLVIDMEVEKYWRIIIAFIVQLFRLVPDIRPRQAIFAVCWGCYLSVIGVMAFLLSCVQLPVIFFKEVPVHWLCTLAIQCS